MPNERYLVVKERESNHLPQHHCRPISIGRTWTLSLFSFTGFENNGLPIWRIGVFLVQQKPDFRLDNR
jgi:hypothetical protein